MAHTAHVSVRVPTPLRDQLAAAARAEDRSFSALVVSLLDRGVVERAKELALVREIEAAFDGKQAA